MRRRQKKQVAGSPRPETCDGTPLATTLDGLVNLLKTNPYCFMMQAEGVRIEKVYITCTPASAGIKGHSVQIYRVFGDWERVENSPSYYGNLYESSIRTQAGKHGSKVLTAVGRWQKGLSLKSYPYIISNFRSGHSYEGKQKYAYFCVTTTRVIDEGGDEGDDEGGDEGEGEGEDEDEAL
tara:strand:+ start:236 stop:775 length:540 start_codon:yes stop_codon:yes gene_type:complete